jgi:hypothetical protein
VFGLAIASLQRITQLDELRHAVERMDPAHYLASSYYERWLSALATLLVEKGIMAREAVPDMPPWATASGCAISTPAGTRAARATCAGGAARSCMLTARRRCRTRPLMRARRAQS